MGDYDFILDEMIFSYSRVETYERCPYCFLLNYILKKQSTEGAFGQYGGFCHKLLEKYFKNELMSFELSDEYTKNFTTEVNAYFPPMKNVDLAAKYYEQGLEYFNNFDGFDDKYEVLGVESQYKFKVDKYNFTGIIDIELKNIEENYYELADHKSKSKQDKNKLSKKDNPEDYIQLVDGRYIPFSLAIQLYIYCIPFKEKYGEYPKYLNFNMFRINDWYKFEFNLNDFERSKKWIVDTIEKIYNDSTWSKGKDVTDFWCRFTCGMNIHCEYSDKYLGV